jgi:uncharacterized protein involved in exopolysaccharide biosynthesis
VNATANVAGCWNEPTPSLRCLALCWDDSNAMSTSVFYLRFGGIAALAGAILAMAASFAVPRQYVSSAVLRMTPRRTPENPIPDSMTNAALDHYAAYQLGQVASEVLSRYSLVAIIQQPSLDLYPEERARMPLEDVIVQMKKDLQISPVPVSPPCGAGPSLTTKISFAYRNREKAQAVVQSIVNGFHSVNTAANAGRTAIWRQVWPPSDPPPPEEVFEVLEPARLPYQSIGPNRLVFLAGGLGGGLLLVLITASVKRRPKWTLQMAAFAAAGCAVAIAVSFLLSNRYTSTATLLFTPAIVPERLFRAVVGMPATERMPQMEQEILGLKTLTNIIQKPSLDLYPGQRTHTPIEEIIDKMRSRDLTIRLVDPPVGATLAFSVSFSYPDQDKAAMVVRELVAHFENLNILAMRSRAMYPPEENADRRALDPLAGEKLTVPASLTKEQDEVHRALEHKLGENLEVLDPANVPETPDGPDRLTLSAAGLAIGLLAGGLTMRLRQHLITTNLRTA